MAHVAIWYHYAGPTSRRQWWLTALRPTLHPVSGIAVPLATPPQPQEVDTGPLVTGDTRDGRSDRKYCDTGLPTHYDTGHPTHYDTGNGIPEYGYRMNNTTSEMVRRLMSGIRYPIAGIVVGPVSVIAVPLATVQRPEFDTGHPDPE